MFATRRYRSTATAVATVLLLAACNGSSDSSKFAASASGEDSVSVGWCDPGGALIPSDVVTSCGAQVLNAVTARLVGYGTDGSVQPNLAGAIDTDDAKTFRVTLKEGITFSDGSPITAHSFVDAWNWAAYGPHTQADALLFAPIAGFSEVHPTDPDGSEGLQLPPTPTALTMSGLAVLNDHTFTIGLSQPDPTFPQRLGMIPFAPLPASFFTDDGAKFGQEPIGAGPFKVDSWDHGHQLVLKADSHYVGSDKPVVQRVVFRSYSDPNAAYNDVVSNKLDVIDGVPQNLVGGGKFKDDLGDRWVSSPRASVTMLRFPRGSFDRSYYSQSLRRAVSEAIDRPDVVEHTLSATATAASGWVPPGVGGYEAGRCAQVCAFNKEDATRQYRNSGGHSGDLLITYDSATDGAPWNAVCASIHEALAKTCSTRAMSGDLMRRNFDEGRLAGMMAQTWTMDYPSIEDFLTPLYFQEPLSSSASRYNFGTSNGSRFSSDDVNDAIVTATAATKMDAAFSDYRAAEEKLRDDLPSIPLWYGATIGAFSDRVHNVAFDAFGYLDLSKLTITK
ncbi:MAG TPA: ABC transporter substrate-binding protein [Sporichthyaceae bacterium]|nr:ABC transporter substrate-binding protein [Sporichthyaceae bacterium]